MEYAKSLMKSKAGKNASRRDSIAVAKSTGNLEAADVDDDVEEEAWTFVGGGETDVSDDLDAESILRRTMADAEGATGRAAGASRARKPALGSRVLSNGSSAAGARGAGVS
jgi:sterol 3beta-glucosyltransferase